MSTSKQVPSIVFGIALLIAGTAVAAINVSVPSIVFGISLLIAGTAAAVINVSVLPPEQVTRQLDVLALMSNSPELPVDLYVSP
jgi:hypothetical protein